MKNQSTMDNESSTFGRARWAAKIGWGTVYKVRITKSHLFGCRLVLFLFGLSLFFFLFLIAGFVVVALAGWWLWP